VIDLDLELRIAGDYADLFDVKEHRLVRRGSLESRWDQDDGMLTTIYRNRDFERTGSPSASAFSPRSGGITACSGYRWAPTERVRQKADQGLPRFARRRSGARRASP